MRRTRSLGSAYIACATMLAVLLAEAVAPAQDVTAPALKAAFIYNFAKFTEWPGDVLPPKAPLVICVLGDKAVADALGRALKDRELSGHPLSMSYVAATGPVRTCQVLYLSEVPAAQAAQIVAGLGDAPVLTVSDLDGFAEFGIVQLFFEHGQPGFAVNLDAAKRARLHISSRLLVLAKRR